VVEIVSSIPLASWGETALNIFRPRGRHHLPLETTADRKWFGVRFVSDKFINPDPRQSRTGSQAMIEYWQVRREGGLRGIVEIVREAS
jgi:hypothetical protein